MLAKGTATRFPKVPVAATTVAAGDGTVITGEGDPTLVSTVAAAKGSATVVSKDPGAVEASAPVRVSLTPVRVRGETVSKIDGSKIDGSKTAPAVDSADASTVAASSGMESSGRNEPDVAVVVASGNPKVTDGSKDPTSGAVRTAGGVTPVWVSDPPDAVALTPVRATVLSWAGPSTPTSTLTRVLVRGASTRFPKVPVAAMLVAAGMATVTVGVGDPTPVVT